jgi:glycosyltransferase involved in cell wall biosynthesis
MTKKKKILIDLLKLNNLYVGLGQVSLHFGKAIAAIAPIVKDEFEFTFLVPKNFVGYFGNDINYQTSNFFKRHFSFLNSKFDVWHSVHQDSAFIPSSKTKYVLTIHDLNFLYEKNKSKSDKKLHQLQQKINKADAIFSISNFTKKEIENHLSLNGKKIETIYNGVESVLEKPSTKPVWHSSEKKYLLALGNCTAKKNFHVLIPMMKLLPEFDLIIAGNNSTSYGNEMKKTISEFELKNVHLVGSVSEEEKNYLLQNCSAFVFPSLFEGFGLPVIEAMSYGKPVFVSKCTSLPEIAADKGFYFESFDAATMKNLIQSSLQTQSENNSDELKLHAAKFSWSKNADEYCNIYKKL